MICAKWLFFLTIYLLFLSGLNALDLHLTKSEVGLDIRGEYNRAFNFIGDVAVTGAVEFNDRYSAKAGLSLGGIGDDFDIKAFGSLYMIPFSGYGFKINLAYIYNGLPGYETHSHSVLPYISYYGRWAGIALGVNLRNTSFFGEPPLFESMLSFSGYVNFVNDKLFVVGIKCANFYDFQAGNMGSYSISINGRLNYNKNLSLVSELELLQSGSIGLSAIFYGVSFRMGVRFIW
jgi:hypothetical protein